MKYVVSYPLHTRLLKAHGIRPDAMKRQQTRPQSRHFHLVKDATDDADEEAADETAAKTLALIKDAQMIQLRSRKRHQQNL